MKVHRICLVQLRNIDPLRPQGYADDFISRGKIDGNTLLLADDAYRELWIKYRPEDQPSVVIGPGTALKQLISRLGFKPKPGCKCESHIREMNQKGPDWCEQNIDTIVGWLREEAERAGYPFTAIGAKLLVRRAISNARKKW